MQRRAGLGGKQLAARGERGALGGAPGLRHNPVFGSPGGEFPPLHPPGPPPPVPGARGHLLGSLKTTGLCHPAGRCRGSKEAGQPSAPTLGIGGEGGDPPPRSREPVPPAQAWKEGHTWARPLSSEGQAGTPRPPPTPGRSCLPSDQDIVLWGWRWGGGRGGGAGTKVLVL